MSRKLNPEDFWKRVEIKGSDDCWPWQNSIQANGYGGLSYRGKMYRAHRLAWILKNGKIPKHNSAHGICVCHTCDNKRCCNPNHLFLGTHTENMMDKVAKGRQHRMTGSNNPISKLTESDVSVIKSMIGTITYEQIGNLFGITRGTVWKIKSGLSWSHVR